MKKTLIIIDHRHIKRNIIMLLTLCLCCIAKVDAQDIKFNEIVSSNNTLTDEDGDTPDWIELLNKSNSAINLSGWSLTDDIDDPKKWSFPDTSLQSNNLILVWASGKNKNLTQVYRTLITQGSPWKYLVPSSNIASSWTSTGYNDSTWATGNSGFGYGDGDDATTVANASRSIYLRKNFVIDQLDDLASLVLHIDYDDGFIAYINGIEVARANMIGTNPLFNAFASGEHEALMYSGEDPVRFDIADYNDILQEGDNILAIQVHNATATSSDLTIIPFLTVEFKASNPSGIDPPEILNLTNESSGLHTNFRLSSDAESIYLFDNQGLLIDSLQKPKLPPNISVGYPVNKDEIAFFTQPTPRVPNYTFPYQGINEPKIIFSHPGGPISSVNLSLTGLGADEVIRYTLDGKEPTSSSPIYTGPFNINTSRVIRARIYKDDYIPSTTQSRAYLTSASHQLPVISLVTDPFNLFDTDYGIYAFGESFNPFFPFFGANFWEDWERPITMSLYNNNQLLHQQDLGVKIFGGYSRANNQKSLSLFARSQYGEGSINYSFFSKRSYETYQSIVLRNSGNDWLRSNMRDATVTGLMEGSNLEVQAYNPVVAYINAEYWGIYGMREKINEHFLSAKYNLNPDDIDLLELNGVPIHGSNTEYLNLINFVSSNNLSEELNYNQVADQIDIDNYILYCATQIYFNNTDWPGNNIKYWKVKGGKWRWILFDTDFSLNIWSNNMHLNFSLNQALSPNGPGWPNPPWSTLLFRKLNENIRFRNKFINQLADEMNSRFLPEKVNVHIDTLSYRIAPEINRHYSKWGENPVFWNQQIQDMKTFIYQRPQIMKQHIRAEYNLPAFHQLNVVNNQSDRGYVKVNSLRIQQPSWQGDYFESVPITMTAIAAPGYKFSHWTGYVNSTSAELTIDMKSSISLTPVFELSDIVNPIIVINEINYNSSEQRDTEDWVELYNPYQAAIDLSAWELKDNDDSHSYILPEGTSISAKGYLILCRNAEKFKVLNPSVDNVVGNFDFGLSSSTDAVRIYNPSGSLIDEVIYTSTSPWPTGANGTGASIELLNPSLDNTLGQNWQTLHDYGSPGLPNVLISTIDKTSILDARSIHPNPSNGEINIHFYLQTRSDISINLYDIHGNLVENLLTDKLANGEHTLSRILTHLPTGNYIIKLSDQNNSFALPWVKI